MDHFTDRHAELACEPVSVSAVADAVGTLTSVYSEAALLETLAADDRAFAGLPHIVRYAIKANANLVVRATLRRPTTTPARGRPRGWWTRRATPSSDAGRPTRTW